MDTSSRYTHVGALVRAINGSIYRVVSKLNFDGKDHLHFADMHGKRVQSAQWEVPKCMVCGKSKNIITCPGCQKKYCSECLIDHHANHPSHSDNNI